MPDILPINDPKPDDVTVIQMQAFLTNANGDVTLYGLGNDGKPYFWNYNARAWFCNWKNDAERAVADANDHISVVFGPIQVDLPEADENITAPMPTSPQAVS